MSSKPDYYKYTSFGAVSWAALVARRRILLRFLDLLRPRPDETVLDVGVTRDCSRAESNFFEALYPHRDRITAASIEAAEGISALYPGVRFVPIAAGQPLPFAGRQFDLAFCNAVLEHVGAAEQQRAFVSEVVRVSKRGLIATPYRYFPIETHTVLPLAHWLPRSWHKRVLIGLGMTEFAGEDRLRLLDRHDFLGLFPAGTRVAASFVRLLGWPSNIVVAYWNDGGTTTPQFEKR